MEDLTSIVENILERDNGYIKNNNYKVKNVMPNYCELEGIITDTSMNNMGIAHGGYIFGLADTAGGIAVMTDGAKVVTINSSINYFKPAVGKKILAKAEVLKNGKNVRTCEVNIFNEDDELISQATITYYCVKSA